MAKGKILTGFSKPYVATYSYASSTVTYASGQQLARGVQVALNINTADESIFYADNVAAESAPGIFTDGTCDLTVDGLLNAAEKLILGLPTPATKTVGSDTVDIYNYGDSMEPPYVGIGFIARYQQDGVESYVPVILPKCRFKAPSLSAATQAEAIDWQTQELSANIFRDDTANHNWKMMAEDQTSEADAEAVIKAIFGITT